MDYYKNSLDILEIDINYTELTPEYLNKQYKRLALKNHPDKNGNTYESTEKFKQINEAYHFLKSELDENYINEDYNSSLYVDILKEFIKTFFEGNYNDILTKIISNIITAGKNMSIKLFDELDKNTTLNIYTFLSKNKVSLHLNNEILDLVREILIKKYNNVEIYKLNPSINDLLNNNLYKLNVHDNLFLVPLWHNISYFDVSYCELMVICEPELPSDIELDENNNIYIETEISLYDDLSEMIINNYDICIHIGDKKFFIPVCNLYMKREKYYYFKGKGISKEKKDIYDISDRSDIIVKIKIIK